MQYIWAVYIHIISVMAFFSLAATAHVLWAKTLEERDLARLRSVDRFGWITGLVALATGWYLTLGGAGKPLAFYFKNPMMHAKLTLMVIVLILAAWVTYQMKSVSTALMVNSQITRPKSVAIAQRLQLTLLLCMPFLGLALGRGLGLSQ
jgi:putative membrane protein